MEIYFPSWLETRRAQALSCLRSVRANDPKLFERVKTLFFHVPKAVVDNRRKHPGLLCFRELGPERKNVYFSPVIGLPRDFTATLIFGCWRTYGFGFWRLGFLLLGLRWSLNLLLGLGLLVALEHRAGRLNRVLFRRALGQELIGRSQIRHGVGFQFSPVLKYPHVTLGGALAELHVGLEPVQPNSLHHFLFLLFQQFADSDSPFQSLFVRLHVLFMQPVDLRHRRLCNCFAVHQSLSSVGFVVSFVKSSKRCSSLIRRRALLVTRRMRALVSRSSWQSPLAHHSHRNRVP